MKTFRYKLGHEAGKTMTVAELKDKLNEYPEDMPVVAAWESVNAYIKSENFETYSVCKGEEDDREMCLVIDVDQY